MKDSTRDEIFTWAYFIGWAFVYIIFPVGIFYGIFSLLKSFIKIN